MVEWWNINQYSTASTHQDDRALAVFAPGPAQDA
jgi:hypothetical protein